MKQHLFTNIFRWGLLIALVSGVFLPSLSAQTEEDPSEKIKARLSLDYYDRGSEGKEIKATVKAKLEDAYEKIPGLQIQFFYNEATESNLLGTGLTDSQGEATLSLPEEFLDSTQSLNSLYFLAIFEGNEQFQGAEQEAGFGKSNSELALEEEDSIRYMRFSITAPDSTGETGPVADVSARFFVRRMFGLLPISEDSEVTDEEGNLRLEFPRDIPGDASGNIDIIAMVEGHETFGTILLEKSAGWGVAAAVLPEHAERTLWSARANAPVYLILVANAVILGIWSVIIMIFRDLFRIKKLGTSTE